MEIQLDNLDFALAVNTFSDDVNDKLELLTKIQLEFLRKFQHRVQIADYHSEMVFEIRTFVSTIQDMYKDVKDYFLEMKVQFVYNFVRKIQTLMVIGYNHLSQALLITLDMYEDERKKNKESKVASSTCLCQNKHDYFMSKDQLKRLEHIDYTINSLQSQEERLMDEMGIMYDRMMMEKNLIEKVKPSLAIKELEEMKDHIESVMENNEKLFEETYMMKFFEFHSHIQKLDKPQKISEVYNTFNKKFQQNFIGQVAKAAKRIQHDRRFNPQRMRDAETQTTQLKAKKKERDSPKAQTISIFNKSGNSMNILLAKEKKLNQKMNIELNMLQRQNLALNEELHSYKNAEKQIEIKYRELIQKFEVIEGMYRQTKLQLDEKKRQEEFQQQQIVIENKKLKNQLEILKIKSGTGTPNAFQVEYEAKIVQRLLPTKSKKDIMLSQLSVENKETQTIQDDFSLPTSDDELVKILKTRNEKAITLLNEKERKIRETVAKISLIQSQNIKIKTSLNLFVGAVEEQFIGSKYQPDDIPELKSNKQSILDMNPDEIQTKIKKIITFITPTQTMNFDAYEHSGQVTPSKIKFKKVTSIRSKPFHTLQDEQLDNFSPNPDSNNELSNVGSTENYSKTICNFNSDSFDQKKKKRLNVMAALGNRRNYNQLKTDAEVQTEFIPGIYGLKEQFRNSNRKSPRGSEKKLRTLAENQELSKQQIQGSHRNSQTKVVFSQKKMDSKNHKRSQSRNHDPSRNSIESRNSKTFKAQRPSTNKAKNDHDSNHGSQRNTATAQQRKKRVEKTHLNTFEKIKIKDYSNEADRQNHSRSFARTGLSDYLEMQKKMGETTQSLSAWKNSTEHSQGIQTQQFLKSPNNTSILEDYPKISQGLSKLHKDRTQRQYERAESQSSSKLYPQSKSKLYTTRENTPNQRLHNRITSEIPSTFRPITEDTECDKQNESTFNSNYLSNTAQRSFFKNFEHQSPQMSMTMTGTSPFSKFKAEQMGSASILRKKKTLLLSIQTFKPKESKTNDMLLERYLQKMVHKWGIQKIKGAFNSLLLQATS